MANPGQRFGFAPRMKGPVIWIHAVSAGESIAAFPMIEELLSGLPGYSILVTNMTPTGRERVISRYKDNSRVVQSYAPWDLSGAVSRFIKRVRPELLVIVDTELWPNYLHVCKRNNIKSILVNGRLSERSARGYARVPSLTRQMLSDLAAVAVQSESQGERFIHLGLDREKLFNTGSIKFDLGIPEDLAQKAVAYRKILGADRKVMVAASTHPGEEDIILKTFIDANNIHPETILVLAPRHPHRFAEVEQLLVGREIEYERFSRGNTCGVDCKVLLVDTIGELLYFYSLADIAFVGGSLVPVGGHNLMEAAVFGVPILMGKHLQNIEDIAGEFVRENALELVDETSFYEKLSDFMANPDKRKAAGEAALHVMKKNQGALSRVVELLYSNLGPYDR